MKRFLYILFIIKWKIDHIKKDFKGMKHPCFNEWKNNEYLEK